MVSSFNKNLHISSFYLIIFLITLILSTNSLDFTSADHIIENAINQGLFSGGVLGIASQNTTYYKKAYGTISPKRGLFSPLMQADYKFDINFLTQVIGTNSVLMQLHDTHKLNFTKKVSSILSDFDNNGKHNITIENLLQHNSGLPKQYKGLFPGSKQMLLKNIEGMKLDQGIESGIEWTELGYVVLGHLIEKQKNMNLKDAMVKILQYAGMKQTSFTPITAKNQIVPGGFNHGICQGIAYNKYSQFLNSMAGNSGLFSTVDNLIHYMQLMLNKGKMPNAFRVFSQQMVNYFTTVSPHKKYHNYLAKGWYSLMENCPCGEKFGLHSFGLGDTSGSYIWADKDKNVTIVFLANGNFPFEKPMPTEFQGKLSDEIMKKLGF